MKLPINIHEASAAFTDQVSEGRLDLFVDKGFLEGFGDSFCIGGGFKGLSSLLQQSLIQEDAGAPLG